MVDPRKGRMGNKMKRFKIVSVVCAASMSALLLHGAAFAGSESSVVEGDVSKVETDVVQSDDPVGVAPVPDDAEATASESSAPELEAAGDGSSNPDEAIDSGAFSDEGVKWAREEQEN